MGHTGQTLALEVGDLALPPPAAGPWVHHVTSLCLQFLLCQVQPAVLTRTELTGAWEEVLNSKADLERRAQRRACGQLRMPSQS